ncbi:MAG: YcbK family protein [Acidimicrobiia bacterium]
MLLEDNQALIEELAALRQRLLEAGLEPPRILEGGELTPNFSVWEFACNDGTPVPDAALPGLRRLCQDVLQPLRDRFGTCHVTSGFRTEAYNAAVGGATASFHIYTLHLHEQAAAADVYFESGSLSQWAGYADQLLGGGGGVGAYPAQGFLHVDNGPRVWRQ